MYKSVEITQRNRNYKVSFAVDLVALNGKRQCLAVTWTMVDARIIARSLATEHYARLKIRPENIHYV